MRQRADLVLNPPDLRRVEVSLSVGGDQASRSVRLAQRRRAKCSKSSMDRLREVLGGRRRHARFKPIRRHETPGVPVFGGTPRTGRDEIRRSPQDGGCLCLTGTPPMDGPRRRGKAGRGVDRRLVVDEAGALVAAFREWRRRTANQCIAPVFESGRKDGGKKPRRREGAEAPPAKAEKLILFIVIGVLVLVLLGGGAASLLMKEARRRRRGRR